MERMVEGCGVINALVVALSRRGRAFHWFPVTADFFCSCIEYHSKRTIKRENRKEIGKATNAMGLV
jgi:hypothetical protein